MYEFPSQPLKQMNLLTYWLPYPKEPLGIVMWALFNVGRWTSSNKQAVDLLKFNLLKKWNKILIYVYSDKFYSNFWEVVLFDGPLYTWRKFRFETCLFCVNLKGLSFFDSCFLYGLSLLDWGCSLTTTSLISYIKFLKGFLLLRTFAVFNLSVWHFMELFCSPLAVQFRKKLVRFPSGLGKRRGNMVSLLALESGLCLFVDPRQREAHLGYGIKLGTYVALRWICCLVSSWSFV